MIQQSGMNKELSPIMPVLDDMKQAFGRPDDRIRAFFGLQHLFGSTATLVQTIVQPRLAPEDVYLLGKPYSTNPRVAGFLKDSCGYNVHPDSIDQPLGIDNDSLMDDRILDVLRVLSERIRNGTYGAGGRVLVIDDGGRVIRLLHDTQFEDVRPRFTCVEQTRCGIRTIADIQLEIPVINVAESHTKLTYESPLIAQSVVQELERKLRALANSGVGIPDRATICGFGAIGKAVAISMRDEGYAVKIHDIAGDRLEHAAAEGFVIAPSFASCLGGGAVVVGCTGLPLMDTHLHDAIAPGTILVSASSSDIEFRGWQLRSQGECLGDPAFWPQPGVSSSVCVTGEGRRWDHPCFGLYRIASRSGHFHLINGGFPINFNGGVDPIVPEKIQLTRSLLYLGALQASHTNQAGLQPLDVELQSRLLQSYLSRDGLLAA